MWPFPESLSFSLLPLEFSDSLSTPSLICDQGRAPGLQGPTWIPDRAQPKLTEGWPGLDAAPDGPPSKPQNDHHPFPSIPNQRLSDFTLTFHFHALEKEMATHFSVLAWRIPGIGEPGGLPSMGSHRVGHD